MCVLASSLEDNKRATGLILTMGLFQLIAEALGWYKREVKLLGRPFVFPLYFELALSCLRHRAFPLPDSAWPVSPVLFTSQQARILVIGLDNSGKTTLLAHLKPKSVRKATRHDRFSGVGFRPSLAGAL
jgi:polynucleotide 5'-kinase involved in rRNA processing